MRIPYYETFREPLSGGIRANYVTAPGGYHPPHWHEELEILYHLNGESDITIDGKNYHLYKKHMIVIDSGQVHSTRTQDRTSMFLCIHISKDYMEKYVQGLKECQIRCTQDEVNDDNFEKYLEICNLLKRMTEAYMEGHVTFPMEMEGIVLQAFSQIVRYFSHRGQTVITGVGVENSNRLRKIIAYVIEHFREELTLEEIAGEVGLSKEYFCRFFKKYMGMSFLHYVNQVRAAHIYQDLEQTDLSIADIMEQNGFKNQKLFHKTFKEIYGTTPSAVRKGCGQEPG